MFILRYAFLKCVFARMPRLDCQALGTEQGWSETVNDQAPVPTRRRIRLWTRNKQQRYGMHLDTGGSLFGVKDTHPALPPKLKPSLCLRFNQLTQGIYITMPYTLAVYMVRHFEGDTGNEESIGRNTGLLVSTFAALLCLLCCLPSSQP